METGFHISYTLDVLSFIGLMLDESEDIHSDDIDRFKPMLGTVSDKYLKKLGRIYDETPKLIPYLITILISNHNLHILRTSQLLGAPNQLIDNFKKSAYYKESSASLRRFIKYDFKRSVAYMKTITVDLERLGFKSFWLEEKLPLLKQRATFYEGNSVWLGIVKYANSWTLNHKIPTEAEWYILTYNRELFTTLFDRFNLVDLEVEDDFFEQVVTYSLREERYVKLTKTLKPTPQLKQEFKGHTTRKSYGKVAKYVEMCLKLALKAYLLNHLKEEREDHLEIPTGYPFATELYSYLHDHPRTEEETLKNYILHMMKHFSK